MAARTRKRPVTTSAGKPPPLHHAPACDWVVSPEFTANGRAVEKGTEVSITGEPGRFVFLRHVERPSGVAWIDVLETYRGTPQGYRSFRPDRIKTVHRLTRIRRAS